MATQKLKEKVQQHWHDEDAESSKTGCESPSKAGYSGDSVKHMSKCLHWSVTAMPATAFALPFGGGILLVGSKIPPRIFGGEIWNCSQKNFHPQKNYHPPFLISVCYYTKVLLCFIDPRVRKIRNEASSCPGIFSRTVRFYYVASSVMR